MTSRNNFTHFRVLFDNFVDEILGRDSYKPILLCELFGLGSSSRAWWSLENNCWRSSGRDLAESNLQHANEVGLNLLFLHICGIDLEKERLEHLFDS